MLEVMLTGSNVVVVPGSGPGNKKLLAGNKTNGWFGIQDTSVMLSISELMDKLGRPPLSVTPTTVTPGWLKTIINGKPIFVLNAPLYSTFWINIYNQGWMLGNDDRPYVPYGATASTQITVIDYTDSTGKVWFFKVRTIRGTTNYVTDGSTTELQNSEHALVYGKITANQVQVDGLPAWDKLTQGIDYENLEWMTSSVNTSYAVASATYVGRSYRVINGGSFRNLSSYSSNWVPVLELLNPDEELLPPINIFVDPYVVAGANAIGSTDSESLMPGVIVQLSTDERGANVTVITDNVDKLTPTTLVYLATDELPALFSQ